jgi:hypothetical protein
LGFAAGPVAVPRRVTGEARLGLTDKTLLFFFFFFMTRRKLIIEKTKVAKEAFRTVVGQHNYLGAEQFRVMRRDY